MALILADQNAAHEIADRIRKLIARQDHGDVTVAAKRLECPIADVYLPERVLSGNEPHAIEFLATVIRTYEADACWLITGSIRSRPLSSEAKVTILELLDELGDRLLDEVKREH